MRNPFRARATGAICVFLLVLSLTYTAPTVKADPTIAAFIGDSYTEGYLAGPDARWTSIVAQRMGWDERNFGRGGTGYVTSSVHGPPFRDMVDDAASTRPDIVVVAGGVNDRLAEQANPADVARAVLETFEALRDRLPAARIIAVGPTFTWHVTPALATFDQDVARASVTVGAQYISLIDPPVITQDMMLPDQLHLTPEGHTAIADRVLSQLKTFS